MSPAARRLLIGTLGAALLVNAVVGCGDGDAAVSHDELTSVLAERHRVDAGSAECIADAVEAAYSEAEIRLIVTDEITALPPTRWQDYTYSVVACGLGEELGMDDEAGP